MSRDCGKGEIYLRLNERRAHACEVGPLRCRACSCCRPRPRTSWRSGRCAAAWPPTVPPPDAPRLATASCGFELPHPLGLAAGFDKNAVAVPGLFGLGFGFVEIGTVTPRPQAGNPRPRLFRLRAQQALINRMGFNNDGPATPVRARLAGARHQRARARSASTSAPRTAADPIADYVACLRGLVPLADYVVVNVSSPNTPGLRDLQGASALSELLAALRARAAGSPAAAGQSRCCSRSPRPRAGRRGERSPRWRWRSASTG